MTRHLFVAFSALALVAASALLPSIGAAGDEKAEEAIAFEISIGGMTAPKLTGTEVKVEEKDGELFVSLNGPNTRTQLYLKGAKKGQVGTFDPGTIRIGWIEEKITCNFNPNSPIAKTTVKFQVKKHEGGFRGEFTGEMKCTNADFERKNATISGWFVG